jgi:hypothetical protein
MDTTEEMLMKKMTAFVMALALVCTNVPANLHVQTGTETVYAAQETAINSEQDLIAMQNNPKGKYYLAKDITITKKLNIPCGQFYGNAGR